MSLYKIILSSFLMASFSSLLFAAGLAQDKCQVGNKNECKSPLVCLPVLSASSNDRLGVCEIPKILSLYDELGPDPEFSLDGASCQGKFTDAELESRIGLLSNWEGQGTYRYWFTSLPNKNVYRIGDEAFILAYIWLFKNTDIDSKFGANFKAKLLAQELYDIFDLFYAEGVRRSFSLMEKLDKLKKCLDVQGPIAFQLQYQIDDILEESLMGTIRAYQCGGVENLNETDLSCKSEENKFFADSLMEIATISVNEHNQCADVLANSCQKNFTSNWHDPSRHEFIVNAIKEETGEDYGNMFGGPYHNLGIDGLVDPPLNSLWAPEKLKNNVPGLFSDLNSKNQTLKITMPGPEGRPPNFHWQVLLQPEKLNEAFPANPAFKGLSFLHYHEKMSYITPDSSVYHLASGSNPSADESIYWNGPLTIASEAVRIMEHYSASDDDGLQHLRQLHMNYHNDVVRPRLGRLMQFYIKKLQMIQQEKLCLAAKIRVTAERMGVDVNDASYDPAQVVLDSTTPSCIASSSGGGGGDSGSSSNLATSSGPQNYDKGALATDAGLGSGTQLAVAANPNQDSRDITINIKSRLSDSSKALKGINLKTLSGNSLGLNLQARSNISAAIGQRLALQKSSGLLEKKKNMDSHPQHPEIVLQQKMQEVGHKLMKSRSSLSLLHGNGASASLAVEGADKPAIVAANRPTGKVAAIVSAAKPVPVEEKIKIVVKVDKNTKDGAQVSHTGLSPDLEEKILSHINPADFKSHEDDSLWIKVTNAYIKSYRKLFRSKN